MTTQNWPQDPLVPSTTGTEYESGSTQAGQSTKSVAKGQAKEVGQEGANAAQHVAQTAASEAKNVAQEAGSQAKSLVSGLGSDLKSQAGAQQQKATEGLRSISDELRSMAEKSDNKMVSNLVQQASQRTGSVAGWLENRDAADLLEDVKGFARQRPGAFLAIAAGAGLVVGRLTRGLAGAQKDEHSAQSATPRTGYGYGETTETIPQTSRGTHVAGTTGYASTTTGYADTTPAFVDPASDYPTIPPGTPPVGTLPDERDLR